MQRFKIGIVAVMCLFVLVTILASLPFNGAQAQGRGNGPSDVNVVNTPTVNAQQRGVWDVGITGTAAVAVTNTPNVTISGTPTVTVGNTAANPLFVRHADNPALQPVEIGFDQTMSDGAGQTSCPIAVYTVPAGKTFVLEYVHLFGIGPSVPESLGFSIGGSAGDYPFITEQRGDSQIGSLFYALTEQTRIYFAPSATVNLCAFRGVVKTGFMTARATLSGYLVSTP